MLAELHVLDYFDFWWKIDDDVRWFGPMPLDITRAMVEKRAIFFHTAIADDPWICIGPALGEVKANALVPRGNKILPAVRK